MLKAIAIRMDNIVYTGISYYKIVKDINHQTGNKVRGEFGFITSSNTFVTQQQAAIILHKAGYIHKPINRLTQSHFNSLRLQYPDKFK